MLQAREIILIENLASSSQGLMLKNILMKKFHLPEELICLKNIRGSCEIKTDAIIHLCLKENGELDVKKIDQYVVGNSLSVFLNQKGQ